MRASFDWGFWFLWMVGTTMGWIMGQILLPEMALVLTGLGIGVLQWLILMHRIRKAWRWAVASVAGWTMGGVVVLLALPIELDFLTGLLFGLPLGIAQWLVLRREVRWAGWWIVITPLAWTTALSVLPGFLLSGVIVGVMTGIVLEILLRFPRAAEMPASEG